MPDKQIIYVSELPEIYIENGLLFSRRSLECRVMSPHIAEATARMVLRALDEWRAQHGDNVSGIK